MFRCLRASFSKVLVRFLAGEQYEWLKMDLAKFNRSVTPWLVVTWYPPWYSTYTAHYKEAECMKVAMEELLYSYGTDIVFNGHVRKETQPCLFFPERVMDIAK